MWKLELRFVSPVRVPSLKCKIMYWWLKILPKLVSYIDVTGENLNVDNAYDPVSAWLQIFKS